MNECNKGEGKIGRRSRIRFIFFISFPFVALEQSNVNRISPDRCEDRIRLRQTLVFVCVCVCVEI